MNIKIVSAAFACACCVVGSANATSIVVSDVSVSVGTNIFDAASVGWSFPATLAPGQSLVITQDYQGTPTADLACYNFDLSEYFHQGVPVVQFVTDGLSHVVSDDSRILTAHGVDGNDNEATDWVLAYASGNFEMWFGYANNVPAPCATPTCFPSGFFTSTFFQGAPALRQLGYEDIPHTDQCMFGPATCWDAAAIKFVNTESTSRTVDPVPEPASLLLLGSGLLGLTWLARKRR